MVYGKQKSSHVSLHTVAKVYIETEIFTSEDTKQQKKFTLVQKKLTFRPNKLTFLPNEFTTRPNKFTFRPKIVYSLINKFTAFIKKMQTSLHKAKLVTY